MLARLWILRDVWSKDDSHTWSNECGFWLVVSTSLAIKCLSFSWIVMLLWEVLIDTTITLIDNTFPSACLHEQRVLLSWLRHLAFRYELSRDCHVTFTPRLLFGLRIITSLFISW